MDKKLIEIFNELQSKEHEGFYKMLIMMLTLRQQRIIRDQSDQTAVNHGSAE